MKPLMKPLFVLLVSLSVASCVSQKKFTALKNQYDKSQTDLVKCGDTVQDYKDRLASMSSKQQELENQRIAFMQERDRQVNDLQMQISDYKIS